MRHLNLILLSLVACIAGAIFTACSAPPRESPWEPVPTNYPLTLTALPAQRTPTTKTISNTTPTAKATNNVTVRLDEPFKLKIGQSATVQDSPDSFGFLFHSVIQDSRCPRQMACLVPGEARIHVEPMRGNNLLQPLLELSFSRARINYAGYQVQFNQLDPAPERDAASKEIAPDAYIATFVVSKLAVSATPTGSTMSTTPTALANITARLNEPFTLKVSQWATLPDADNTRVFFTTISEDSRCPSNANCVQAGKVRVLITVESGGKSARFDLSTSAADYRSLGSFGGYIVELIELAPAPQPIETRIPLNDYRVTLRVRAGSLDSSTPRLAEPFTLKLGQTVTLADASTQVMFEAVQQDSRCPTRSLCATSGSANLIIALQREGKTDRLTLNTNPDIAFKRSTVFDAYTVFVNALAPYPQNAFASKEIAPNEYAATLVVVSFAPSPAPRTTTTPASLTSCPDLTRGEAEEILGEAVKETPAEMYLSPAPSNTVLLRGVCGYGSVTFTPNRPAMPGSPSVLPTTVKSDRAVIAGKLTDNRRLEQLISIASALEAANPRSSHILTSKLLTMYAAGAWHREMLDDFPDAARGATGVNARRVENLGDSAIWVWREFEGGRYAALVAQKGETLFVVAALTNAQRTEDNVLTAMTPVMQKMLR